MIKDLEQKTNDYEKFRTMEYEAIKQRYEQNNDESEALKSYHSHEV